MKRRRPATGGLELGPYGYMPLDAALVGRALERRGLSIVAGTIFDDLVAADNLPTLRQTDEICALITKLPPVPQEPGQHSRHPIWRSWIGGTTSATTMPAIPTAPHACRLPTGPDDAPHRGDRGPCAEIRRAGGDPSSCGRLYRVRGRDPADAADIPARRRVSASIPDTSTMPGWIRCSGCARMPAGSTTFISRISIKPCSTRSWASGSGSSTPAARASCARSARVSSTIRRSAGCSTRSTTTATSRSSRSVTRATWAAASATCSRAAIT